MNASRSAGSMPSSAPSTTPVDERPALAARPERESSGDLPCAAGRPRHRSRPAGRRHATGRSRAGRRGSPAARASRARRSRSRALAGRPAALAARGRRPAAVRGPREARAGRARAACDPVEATHLGRDTDRERRLRGRPVTTTRAGPTSPTCARAGRCDRARRSRNPPHQSPSGSASASPTRAQPRSAQRGGRWRRSTATAATQRPSTGPRASSRAQSPTASAVDEQRGQPRSRPPRTRITASRDPAAARPAPVRSPGSHRDRRPSETAPCACRQSTIFCAVTGPMPGSASSCVERSRSRGSPWPLAPRGASRRRLPGRRRARHDDLLPVGERRREVDERDVGPPGRAARAGDRVGDARALRQAVRALRDAPRRRRRRRAGRRGALRRGLPVAARAVPAARVAVAVQPRAACRRARAPTRSATSTIAVLAPRRALEHDAPTWQRLLTAVTHSCRACARRRPRIAANAAPGADAGSALDDER